MIYGFFLPHLLNFLAAFPIFDALVPCADVVEIVFFALLKQKMTYNCWHQPLFIKISELAILWLHKQYSIPTTVGVTKKLTQQYVGSFRIMQKIASLAYRLDIPFNWQIHLIFSVTQLKRALLQPRTLLQGCFYPIYFLCLWKAILISWEALK